MVRSVRSPALPVVLLLALLLLPATALTADDPPPTPTQSDDLSSSHKDIDQSQIERAQPGKEWWRDVVARFPTCKSVTDGCQSCVPEGDAFTCSNPGIACTRGEWRCVVDAKPDDTQQDKPAGDNTPAEPNAPAQKN